MRGEVTSVLGVGATLGEGPVWVEREQAVYFVDIKGHRVHRFDPATAEHRSFAAPAQVGWVLPSDDGLFLAGLQHGVARFDPATGVFDQVRDPEPGLPGNRLNDATVDPQGRLWFGTMDDGESAATGRLWCLDRGTLRDSGLAPVTITNGPAVSPDGRTLYHTDTLGRVIYAVPVRDDGTLGPPAVFAEIASEDGWPDGCVADADGCLWSGLWGGWRVRRYDPAGRVMAETRLPCANVTKIAFGGPDLRTAFVTTARKGLDAAALESQPLAGNLFMFDAGVAGQADSIVRL